MTTPSITYLGTTKHVKTAVERVIFVVKGAVQLHQEGQGLTALAATHVLRGWEIARVEPHLSSQYRQTLGAAQMSNDEYIENDHHDQFGGNE